MARQPGVEASALWAPLAPQPAAPHPGPLPRAGEGDKGWVASTRGDGGEGDGASIRAPSLSTPLPPPHPNPLPLAEGEGAPDEARRDTPLAPQPTAPNPGPRPRAGEGVNVKLLHRVGPGCATARICAPLCQYLSHPLTPTVSPLHGAREQPMRRGAFLPSPRWRGEGSGVRGERRMNRARANRTHIGIEGKT